MESLDAYMNFENSYKQQYIQNNIHLNNESSTTEILSCVHTDVDIVLESLGVSPRKLGYKYWKDAVFLFVHYDKKPVKICSEIYAVIGKKYGKTDISVERAMRLCFENVMYYVSKSEPNYISLFLKNHLLYPHNSELLIKITELIVSRKFQKEKQKSLWQKFSVSQKLFCIKYNVKKQLLIFDEIKYQLKKGKGLCLTFLLCVIVGIVLGVIIALSTGDYVNLLNSNSKVLFEMINGTVEGSKLFWSKLISMIVPLLLIFVLNLNFYVGLVSFLFITYQSALFVMTFMAIISVFGVSGVFSAILIFLPLNVCFLFTLVIFSCVCLIRSQNADKAKIFNFGLSDSWFLISICVCVCACVLICIIGVYIYPLFLKNTMFLIF